MVFLQQCGFMENHKRFYFLKNILTNLIKSAKTYKIYSKNLKSNIFKIIKKNIR